jgi:hypothetical protein
MKTCPNCGREYPDEMDCCPDCGAREDSDPVLLAAFEDETQLGAAKDLLGQAGIAYDVRRSGSGSYLEIATGKSMFGAEIYVDRRDLSAAMDAVGALGAGEPVDEAALAQAALQYPPAKDEPAHKNYKAFLWFLLAFGAFIAVLIVLRTIK